MPITDSNGSCFKMSLMGSPQGDIKTSLMGSPQGDIRSTHMPKHAKRRMLSYNQDDDVFTGVTNAKARQKAHAQLQSR
ncbi:hypothetical protein SDJN03_23200, partial [Cucurbita argyrosperma subsp. sororia]